MELKDELNHIKSEIIKLNRFQVPTGIISLPAYNRLGYQTREAKSAGNSLSYTALERTISELKYGMIDNIFELPSYFEIMESASGKAIDMSVFHIKFNRINEVNQAAFADFQQEGEVDKLDLSAFIKGDGLVEDSVFVCLPLKERVADGAQVTFNFNRNFIFDNTNSGNAIIEFDAGDGKGFRKMSDNGSIEVNYTEKGIKKLRTKIHYGDDLFEGISTLEVIQVNLPQPDKSFDLTAGHYYKDTWAKGKVDIYYSDKDKGLVKPLYFWTGFNTSPSATSMMSTPLDIMDSNGAELFAYNYESLLKVALDNGYDIVTMDWADSRNYIQNNGFLAATLIQKINKNYPNSKDGVIITGSMGGLIARWTTVYMEHEEGRRLYGDHKLAKLITLDTPHEGAVMPLAMQYAIDYIASNVPCSQGDVAREGRKVIQSPAACQMLVQQFTSNWGNQNEPKAHEERAIFLKSWTDMAPYPKKLDMYAISNGSKMGEGQMNANRSATLQPGGLLLSGKVTSTIDVLWIDRLHASPQFPTRNESGLEVLNIVRILKPRWWANVKKSLPYDSCPGGNWEFIPSVGNALNSDRIMPFPSTCFIPALSSVGLVNKDLYRRVDVNKPGAFKAIYMPDSNEPHASLNPSNTVWIMGVLGINV